MRSISAPAVRLKFLGCFIPLLLGPPGPVAAQDTAARDWSKYPAIVKLDTRNDVYAVGDLHGDYACCTNLLFNCKVIKSVPPDPKAVEWAAGNAVFVCTGWATAVGEPYCSAQPGGATEHGTRGSVPSRLAAPCPPIWIVKAAEAHAQRPRRPPEVNVFRTR